MEEFIASCNIERYRRLLGEACDPDRRRLLEDLLTREEAWLEACRRAGGGAARGGEAH